MELKRMPWCPNCKAEYQNGFTVCSDCKIDLVESLEVNVENFVPFFQAEDKKVADKLVRYFQYSDIKSKVDFDEENEVYIVSIPPKQEKQARKLYQAFYFVERDNLSKGELDQCTSDATEDTSEEATDFSDDSDLSEQTPDQSDNLMEDALYEDNLLPEEDYEAEIPDDEFSGIQAEEDTSIYVMKADQYKDLAGTVWIFLLFGIAGLIFVLLNVGGVFTFLNGFIPNAVMGALFLLFIYIAISTNQKAKKVQAEIDTENKLTEEINQWLKSHITESFLSSIHNDNISDELNYLKKVDTIKEMLLKEFGAQNLAYLDRLIEEYYSNTFEKFEE
jgi:hypothetical protein